MRTMLSPPCHTKCWLPRASLEHWGQGQRCSSKTSAMWINSFGHCLSDADIGLYLLSIQASDWNKPRGGEFTYGLRAEGERWLSPCWVSSMSTMTSCGPRWLLRGFPFYFSAVSQISQEPFPKGWHKSSEKLQGCESENAGFGCSVAADQEGQAGLCQGVLLQMHENMREVKKFDQEEERRVILFKTGCLKP